MPRWEPRKPAHDIALNRAQRLYASVLSAKIVATIPDLYSAAEVLMLGGCPDAEHLD